MNKKYLLLALIPILLAGLGAYLRFHSSEDTWICKNGQWVKHGHPSFPAPSRPCETEGEIIKAAEVEKNSNLANPASQNCLDKGGRLEMREETAGTLGICKFNDGTECEEWQFYRGECLQGQTTAADTSHPYRGRIELSAGQYYFVAENGVSYTLQLPAHQDRAFRNTLAAEMKESSPITIIAAETPPLSKILVFKNFQEK